MFARPLATPCCLLSIALCVGRAGSVNPPSREVVVYLTTAPDQAAQPVQEMQREVKSLMETAGYTVAWRNKGEPNLDAGDGSIRSSLVVLQLRGVCQAPDRPADVEPLQKAVSLASSAVANGQVLPFSWLECEPLTKLLASSLARESGGRRNYLYGRAMGRLVAHELLHILANTHDHDSSGVGKSSFSAKDVLAEHFQFESASLARFDEASDAAGSVEDNVDAAAGR